MNTVIKLFLYAAVGYSLMVLLVFVFQRRMIYFPDRNRPSAEAVTAMGLQYWPQDRKDYKGFISARGYDRYRGTILAFHGNAGSAWHRDYFIHALQPLGYRVILAEYPGYGGRPGAISENHLVQDAVGTIKEVQKSFGGPVYLLGESMGCGVVAAAAASPEITTAGLILITPWDSLPDLAQSLYWYLPARILTRDRFDSVSHLKSYNKPVAIAIAQDDEVIPNRHSLRLFNALTAPKRLWQFQGAGHNNWPSHPDAAWWGEVIDFIGSANRKAAMHAH